MGSDAIRLAAVVLAARTPAATGRVEIRTGELGRWLGLSESYVASVVVPGLRRSGIVEITTAVGPRGEPRGLECKVLPMWDAQTVPGHALALHRKELATLLRLLEGFDFDHQRSVKRESISHLGTLDFVVGKENVIFLRPPGTGKTHLATGLGIRAYQAGHRVAFATAAQWVARLADAHQAGKLADELTRLGRIPLMVVDEVGYIPFEPEAANLFFQFISCRYEHASMIVTSNKPFGRWGEVFGDDTVAAAMIDRLVHHAEVISLKGDSYRMRGRDLGRVPPANTGG
ncbi:IS21-like element helper ATPase IstB [Streptomyces goshikiensis]|uniref:IS21-like element helper ATPase IstB n=1 Tax=Streptomyces goshikiensis TaxID=1942 RepID=UPI0036FD120C